MGSSGRTSGHRAAGTATGIAPDTNARGAFLTKGEARTFLGTVPRPTSPKVPGPTRPWPRSRFSTTRRDGGQSSPILAPRHAQQRDSFLHCRHPFPASGPGQDRRIEPADIRIFVADLVEKGFGPVDCGGPFTGSSPHPGHCGEFDGVMPVTPVSEASKAARQTTSNRTVFSSPRRWSAASRGASRTLPGARLHRRLHRHALGANLPDCGCQRLIYSEGPSRLTEALTEGHATSDRAAKTRQRAELLSIPRFLVAASAGTWRRSPATGVYVFSSAEGTRFAGTSTAPLQSRPSSAPGSPTPLFSTISATLRSPPHRPGRPPKENPKSNGSAHSHHPAHLRLLRALLPALMSDCGTDSTHTWRTARGMLKLRRRPRWNCGGRGPNRVPGAILVGYLDSSNVAACEE